eukprot:g40342.t1
MQSTKTLATYVVKTVFQDQTRRFSLEQPKFQLLEAFVRRSYQDAGLKPGQPISVKYKDDEGDFCIVSTDAELAEGLAGNKGVLKLFIEASPVPNAQPASVTVPAIATVLPTPSAAPVPAAVPVISKPEKNEAKKEATKADEDHGVHPAELAAAVISFLSDLKIQETLPAFFNTLLAELKSGLEQGQAEFAVVMAKAITQYEVVSKTDVAQQVMTMAAQVPSPEFVYHTLLQFLTTFQPMFERIPVVLKNYDLEGSKGEWIQQKITRFFERMQHSKPEKRPIMCAKKAAKLVNKLNRQHQSCDTTQPEAKRQNQTAIEEVSSWPHHVCDGCEVTPIVGPRFHCTVCPDFDLCSACDAKNMHPADHPLIKLRQVPEAPRDVHVRIACDGCGVRPIKGDRFQCTVCHDFDLCGACEAKGQHPEDHPLVKHRVCQARGGGAWRGGRRGGPCHFGGRGGWHGGRGRCGWRGMPPPLPGMPAPPPFCGPPMPPPPFCPPMHPPCGPPAHLPPHLQNLQAAVAAMAKAAFGVSPEQLTSNPAASPAATGEGEAAPPKKLDGVVVSESLPHGSVFKSDAIVIKEWTLRNSGTDEWPAETRAVFVRGDRLLLDNIEEFPVGAVPVGKEATVRIAFRMPATSSVRRVTDVFQLVDANRVAFGPRFWAEFELEPAVESKEQVQAESKQEMQEQVTETGDGSVEDATEEDFQVVSAPSPTEEAFAAIPAEPAQAAPEQKLPARENKHQAPKEAAPSQPVPRPASAPVEEPDADLQVLKAKWGAQLKTLAGMGFTNELLNCYLLNKHNGNLEEVVTWLLKLDVNNQA